MRRERRNPLDGSSKFPVYQRVGFGGASRQGLRPVFPMKSWIFIFARARRAGLDPYQIRVACETLATTNRVVIAGEVRGPKLDEAVIAETARAAVKDIGYEQDGFHWRNANVEVLLHAQSADIAQGVDAAGNKDEGAGDQGIMFGYACRETPELMPAPLYYAHKILHVLSEARRSGKEKLLGPDAKSQVTVLYENGKPVGATQIVVSHQHTEESLTSEQVADIVRPHVIDALPAGWITAGTVWHVNPTGKFHIGGPDGDCGLTGRKIIVDTYGGAAPHGGGAFSGKDPHQGRSLGRLRRAVSGQERGRGRSRRSLHPAALLCHRRRQAAFDLRRPARNWAYRGSQARGGADGGDEPLAPRDPRASEAQQTDLCADVRLWTFRPRAGRRGRLLLGRKPTWPTNCEAWRNRRGRRGAARIGRRGRRPAALGRAAGASWPQQGQDVARASCAPRAGTAAASGGGHGGARRRRAAVWFRSEGALAGDRFRRRRAPLGRGRAKIQDDVGFIGCEPFVNGVAKLLAAIDEEGLANVRVRAGDARALIEAAPSASLSRVFILYPDPWPKRRQHKRRLIEEDTIAELARVARPGAELRFATDIDDYAGWTLRRFLASPDFSWDARRADDWRVPWEGWAPTRYEAKARAAGRASAYLTFVRR